MKSGYGVRGAGYGVWWTLFVLGAAPNDGFGQRRVVPLTGVDDTVALRHFLDGAMSGLARPEQIPGAVVVVVKGDRVLFAKGYGRANLEADRLVDPATSMFHIGSTGKLFTWTAVMQLVEAGKVDLDADLNTYLGATVVRPGFSRPVTLRHLLTHTAGFEEGWLGYFISLDSTRISTIDSMVTNHVPTRVRPPGELAAYSNYGAALAGLVVERVSGLGFAEYVEQHIYRPLGIKYATFREPVPAELAPHVVTGYAREEGRWSPQPYEINGGWVPAGGTSIAGLEMAKFMVAHLNGGGLGLDSILGQATATLMHRTAFQHDERLPGIALGFYERRINGRRVIAHGGDSFHFHTDLVLEPLERVGLFVSHVGDGSVEIREPLVRAFFDRFYPAQDSTAVPIAPAGRALDEYAGRYRITRMNYTDFEKVVWLVLPPFVVSVAGPVARAARAASEAATGTDNDNSLLISGGLLRDPARFVPVGRDLFRQVGGTAEVAFRADSAGAISHLFLGEEPTTAAERGPWYESSSFWYPALATSFLLLLSGLLDRGYRRREVAGLPRGERRAVELSAVTAGWLILTLVLGGLVILAYGSTLLGRIPFGLRAVLAMPLIFLGLTAVLGWGTVEAWRARWWTVGRRLYFTAMTGAAVVFSWFFWQWNLVGWQFG